MSTNFHPYIDDKFKQTVPLLEGMIRACLVDFRSIWNLHLPLGEFAYNNNYHLLFNGPI